MSTNQQVTTSVDYNSAVLSVLMNNLTSTNFFPMAGLLVSSLTAILWPDSSSDVWSDIENNIEQLVGQQLSEEVSSSVQQYLSNLYPLINDYLMAVQGPINNEKVTLYFNALNALCVEVLNTLQVLDSDLLLLPIFVQVANLQLGLQRDGIFHAKYWGWSETQISTLIQNNSEAIQQYTAFVQGTYNQAYSRIVSTTPGNSHYTEPFNTINAFVRGMTLIVLDFQSLWQYFDTTVYPRGSSSIYLDREIYSDALGTADNSGPIQLPSPPTKPIVAIQVWAWDRIDACQLYYEPNGGPDGVTQTPRMGDQNGGTVNIIYLQDPTVLPYKSIVSVTTLSGDIVNAITFTYSDGTTSGQLGGKYPGGEPSTFSYPNEILSSIKIMGISDYYGSANCIVYGFKFDSGQLIFDPNVLRTLYVAAPSKLSSTDLASYVGAKDVDQLAASIQQWSESEQWDDLRQKHWDNIYAQLH